MSIFTTINRFADGDHVSANIISTKVGPCLLPRTLNFIVHNYSCICPIRNNLTNVRCIFSLDKNRKRFIYKLEHLTSVRKGICRLLDKFSKNNRFQCVTGETISCCRGSSLLNRFPCLVFHNAITL